MPVRGEADQGRAILTDIDILSVEIDLRLRTSTSIYECKSGAGQSGEPDRLFWLAGFQKYLAANRATLIRGTITTRGKAIARRLGVRILDDIALSKSETAHAWIPERFAHVGGRGCAALEHRTDLQLKGLHELSFALVDGIRTQIAFVPSHRIVALLLALKSSIERQGGLPTPTLEVLAGHSLLALFLAAIRDAGNLESVPVDDLRRRLELALTVGSPSDTHLLDVLEDADAVMRDVVERVHGLYQSRGASRVTIEVPSLKEIVADSPTREIERYIDLVVRLRSNPSIGRDMLQTVELACFDALAGDSAWTAPAFDHLFTPEHRQLLLVGVNSLSEIAGHVLGDCLRVIEGLPFERSAPPFPDRQGDPAQDL